MCLLIKANVRSMIIDTQCFGILPDTYNETDTT